VLFVAPDFEMASHIPQFPPTPNFEIQKTTDDKPSVKQPEEPSIEKSERTSINYKRLASWIKTCNHLHDGHCRSTPVESRPRHQIPDWVIDTQDSCIVPGHTASRYITLSYVWSENKERQGLAISERLMLKQGNLTDFQKPGFLSQVPDVQLPEVVKDTISLVRCIGERFLWVDCLCIIQQDDHTRAQVDRMGEIYSGAYFTVIAAASSGLQDTSVLDTTYNERRHIWKSRISRERYIQSLYSRLLRSRWATRGWTFQEQVLSRRAIIFIDDDVFWDCQSSVWDMDGLIQGHESELGSSHTGECYEMARRMESLSWPDFRMYIELVTLYNGRNLTYPQDSLPAFSGILNSLARSFHNGFVSGLPVLFLDIALLWQPFSRAKRRIPKEGGARSRPLPSWSWCGWQCPVDPLSLRTGLAYLGQKDQQSQALTWQTQNLVQWTALSEDMQEKLSLKEPAMLEKYKEFRTNKDTRLPHGWSRHEDGLSSGSDGAYFTCTPDSTVKFKHPIPIRQEPPSIAHQKVWPFLSCETARAFLRVRAIYGPRTVYPIPRAELPRIQIKFSVFNLQQFADGPDVDDICYVICLEDAQGRAAGQLRLMDDSEVEVGDEIELIAISSGSVNYADTDKSFEEQVERDGTYSYNEGSRSRSIRFYTLSSRRPVKGAQTRIPVETDRVVSQSIKDAGGEGVYHFYNVLWIDRQNDIAYRKAMGRVPKSIWEENCSKPMQVVLG
jgi:hypothetical protein